MRMRISARSYAKDFFFKNDGDLATKTADTLPNDREQFCGAKNNIYQERFQ